MSDQLVTGVITVALGLISLAAMATFFSKNADTANVLKAGSNGLATNILAAVSPVTGNAPSISSF